MSPYIAPAVDMETAELEMTSSIYDGFSTAIMVKGEARTIALCREFSDAVQLMAIIERSRALRDLVIDLHREGILSEGQVSKAAGIDRVKVREFSDKAALKSTAAKEGEEA